MERFVEKGGIDHALSDLPAMTRAQQMKKKKRRRRSQMDRINLASERNPAEHFSIMTLIIPD